MALVAAYEGLVGEHRRRRCRVLLVEGTSIRKRHRYVTVLVNGDTGEVLAMVPYRNAGALSGFLPKVFGARFRLMKRADKLDVAGLSNPNRTNTRRLA